MARKSASYKKIAADLDQALTDELIAALKAEGFTIQGGNAFWDGRNYSVAISVDHRGGTFVGFVQVRPTSDKRIRISLNPSVSRQIKVPNANLKSTCAALGAYLSKEVKNEVHPTIEKIDAEMQELHEARQIADRMWLGAAEAGAVLRSIG